MEQKRTSSATSVQSASATWTKYSLLAAATTTSALSVSTTSTKVDLVAYSDMAQKKMLEPLCCFCRKEDPAIIDVNAKETAKKYIDTPQETPVKNQGLNPRLVRVWSR